MARTLTAEQLEKKKAYNHEYVKARYWWLKERGYCTKCGKERARPGKTTCLACGLNWYYHEQTPEQLQKNNERMKALHAERKQAGLCLRCGKPALPGHQLCYEHNLESNYYSRERKRNNRKRYHEAGLCRFCGGERKEGYMVCEKCYDRLCKQLEYARSFVKNTPFKESVNNFWKLKGCKL